MTGTPRSVVVVGGGISGLTAALTIQELAAAKDLRLTCTVLEAGSAWGGKILTHRVGELVMEAGPDSFLSQKPWALELCEKLGLSDQLMNTNPTLKKACVYSRGRLHELPEGLITFVPKQLGPFLRSGLLSWRGVARMGLEVTVPVRRSSGDESVASFFRRRFGTEVFDRALEPLLAGIYAGDAEAMSLVATFPRFRELERAYGSVTWGMIASRRSSKGRGASFVQPRTMFVTLRNGLSDLVTALVGRLEKAGVMMRLKTSVSALRVRSKQVGQWTYDIIPEEGAPLSTDAVVLATPAPATAALLRPLTPMAAGLIERIPYASTATISLAYDRRALTGTVDGFGFVVPRMEGKNLLAATWTSLKWAHRAPEHTLLVRCYVGGVGREEILLQDDPVLIRLVRDELAAIAGVHGTPSYMEVNRWPAAMPQYTISHLERLDQIEAALSRYAGLLVTGAAYRGVGIPDCVRDGAAVGKQVVDYLQGPA